MTALLRPSAPFPSLRMGAGPHDEPRINLLLIDDDDHYRESVAAELEQSGFSVTAHAGGGDALDFLARNRDADVILLDWRLSSGLGIDLMEKLRARGVNLPIVFLTATPATAYENAALEHGAVDFIDKARGALILAKRVRLIHETHRQGAQDGAASKNITCGKLLLRILTSRAYWNGCDIDLTVTEFDIVRLLVTQAGEHVTYRAIYDCVHHAGFIAGHGSEGYRTNVRSAIKRIRSKFRACDPLFGEIENFAAFGYRWRTTAPQPA